MQALIKNNSVVAYPYSLEQLKLDNLNTSFPATMPEKQLAEWGVFTVIATEKPNALPTTKIQEGKPVLIGNSWRQVWDVIFLTQSEVEAKTAEAQEITKAQRAEAYRTESDPLFFKWQAGESTQEIWLKKREEIRAKFV